MENDVAIDRAALEQAKIVLGSSMGQYGLYAEDTWRRDTGIGNPCGRTLLRVALENALGEALMRVRGHVDEGGELASGLQTVLDSFADLDATLGEGWNRDDVADFS